MRTAKRFQRVFTGQFPAYAKVAAERALQFALDAVQLVCVRVNGQQEGAITHSFATMRSRVELEQERRHEV